MAVNGHRPSTSVSQALNHKAQLATAYNELGRELSSQKIRVVGNYTLGKVIGEGTYGKVRLGVHRLTGTRVAIKQIPKAMSASLTREIHHHRQLHHPHITQLFEVIATESNIWLVTELCSGGELFDYLAEKGRLSEEETRVIFGQLCLAVAYVHSKGIVHRDLKLENVLLDEHCRVKLGDFGFTREFERGILLETFCGTTGYASPEMLMAKKYLGPEVDVWSLGVILYTLLTGTLPFDDDDEDIMKEKVIRGEFEDPEWLSDESRNLLKSILQTDPEKRPTIAQILAHTWFTQVSVAPVDPTASQISLSIPSRPASAPLVRPPSQLNSAVSESTYHSASEFPTTSPATPNDSTNDIVLQDAETPRKSADVRDIGQPADDGLEATPSRPTVHRHGSSVVSSSSKTPPVLPTRTPARTKRRSVSSTLSDPTTPTFDKSSAPVLPQDFSSVLNTPAPIIFSTPLERDLLNSMSALGLDTGQIVHSVLSDACDATGALWWMLKRKTERRVLEEDIKSATELVESPEDVKPKDEAKQERREESRKQERSKDKESGERRSRETPTRSPIPAALTQTVSAPELQLIPPTPVADTIVRPKTPPRTKSPPNALLSPTPSMADISLRSSPSTPGSSTKDKEKDQGSKGRKARSGSVSIMQRATTALEAAGLVRKKSAEGVRDGADKRAGTSEESRASHGSASSRLLKSPPLKPKEAGTPSTPPPSTSNVNVQAETGSPWVMAGNRSSPPLNGTDSPRDTLSALPNITGNKGFGGHRNRASLLSAFRMFFKEDPKGKRKEEPVLATQSMPHGRQLNSSGPSTPVAGRGRGTMKRRISGNRGKFSAGRSANNRAKRASASSRRSSSVNSKRSSVQSAQFPTFDSPGYTNVTRRRSDASRRSFGSHTPNSELDEYVSRPSSVQSFMGHRHRKSPSASSAGSMHPGRAASPLSKYHRRGGSGSSTRVVRQVHAPPHMGHLRSNSASSVPSLTSSRPGSIYEVSEGESRRNSSPHHPIGRRSLEESQTPRRSHAPQTSFVARKRETPFSHPSGGGSGYLSSLGRSSWKKSWGHEPPGWQNRASYSAIEVLAISPPVEGTQGIRDVFSGRTSLNLGDESDWVDEDEDGPGFAGGLGQMPTHAGTSTSVQNAYTTPFIPRVPEVPMLSPPPRGHPGRAAGKRGNAGLATPSAGGRTRSKAGRSPMGRTSPLPDSSFEQAEQQRGGRRPLPASRSGPATIQEDDEGEEE
ncbi:Pkinase-domain-containing protein [Daedalea quercina L-15889]|uniref:non-specific serine/threonine protein kinase n=1 Tax=Daedalea quercina L-15889 TaxID=1314783 RepID=A0A165RDZ4_9APHY|nr:Pkinase-domain-containing protein [Daedalea quercina L-15889]